MSAVVQLNVNALDSATSQTTGEDPHYPSEGSVVCPNISPAERRKRLRFGLISFVIGIAILAVLIAIGANVLWRLPLILFFWGGAVGYFQWHDKTCVALARTNSRKIGEQMEKIEDPAELAAVKEQARRVQLKGFIAGIIITLIALLLPVGF